MLIPAVTPGLITVGLFAFLAAWNDFFAPLILINDSNRMTLPLAVANLKMLPVSLVPYGKRIVSADALPPGQRPLHSLCGSPGCRTRG